MSKLNFDEVMQRINDDRCVKREEVSAAALNRVVYVAEWHLPGCMSESSCIVETKECAIQCAVEYALDEDGNVPRGMLTALRKFGRFDTQSDLYGTCINTVSKHRLIDLL